MDEARARYNAQMSEARRQYPRSNMRAESEDQCIADARRRYHQ